VQGTRRLYGYDSIGMMKDGAMSFNIGKIEPGGKKTFNLFICASHTLKGVKELVRWCRKMNVDEEYEKTRKYWLDFLKNARLIVTGDKNIDNLYKRSILVFKLMSDERTGGLLASAEIDEGFTRCGRLCILLGKGCGIYYRRTGYRRAYRSSGQILPVGCYDPG